MRPERDPKHVARHVRQRGDSTDLIIDGTERRQQRPKNKAIRDDFYSVHKKTHTDKNLVISQVQTRRISFLSQTYHRRFHDKKMAVVYPRQARLWKDTGF